MGQCVAEGDEQLRSGVLIGDVLHLVDVKHHRDVLLPERRTTNLDQEIGEGGVRLGAVRCTHGERDARRRDRLDPAQKVADALLPCGGKPRRGCQLQERGGDSFDGIGARGDAKLRCHPAACLEGLARDPAHE